jgi:PKD repeat protein
VNTPLTVAAPGVLGNDNDPDSEDLVAQVDLGPGHGALVLTPDGAFVYTPTLDFTGVDTFTYVASDGVLTDVAQVRITVAEPISGLVVVNDSPTVLGDTTTFTASVAAGSDVTYTWDLGDGTVGQYVRAVHGEEASWQEEASEPFVLTHVYPAVGLYTAVVTASNSVSELTATTAVTVDEAIAGLEAANDSPTVLGESTTLTATVAAGSNATYTWAFGDGEVGSGAVVTHTYTDVAIYSAVVTASNSIGLLTATTTVEIVEPTVYIYLPLVLRE